MTNSGISYCSTQLDQHLHQTTTLTILQSQEQQHSQSTLIPIIPKYQPNLQPSYRYPTEITENLDSISFEPKNKTPNPHISSRGIH